jgi:hypothetical protein
VGGSGLGNRDGSERDRRAHLVFEEIGRQTNCWPSMPRSRPRGKEASGKVFAVGRGRSPEARGAQPYRGRGDSRNCRAHVAWRTGRTLIGQVVPAIRNTAELVLEIPPRGRAER